MCFLSAISSVRISVAAALVVSCAAAFAAEPEASQENCKAPAKPTLQGPAVSDKLQRCNGVLTPSQPADGDIVVPTPSIDDPLTIHPKEVPGNQGTPK